MKHSTKKRTMRSVAFLLCALMLLFHCPIVAVADDNSGDSTTATTQQENAVTTTEATAPTLPSPITEELGEGELTYAALQSLRVEDVPRPETVTLAMAQEQQHVNRLYAQEEDLYTALFQNRSGNKTAYVFSQPIKYVAPDGSVRDKDTAVTETDLAGYAYAMTDNSFTAYFAENAANGVMMSFAGHSATMKPETSTLVSVATRGDTDNTVLYNNAFGARTALRYQTQLGGVKEDIILLQNVGKNSFRFLLTTTLTPTENNGAWTLCDENGVTVMTLGAILVKDSGGKTVYGELSIEPRAAGGYLMTVTVPAAFLNASDTTYPVYIDPTTTVDEIEYYITYEGSSTIENQYEAIVDVGVYKNTNMVTSALQRPTHHMLNPYSRILYKFADFYEEYGQFSDLHAEQIGNVSLHVPLESGVAGILCGTVATSTWSEEEYPSPPIALYNDSFFSPIFVTDYATQVRSESGIYTVDITDIARYWANYNRAEGTYRYNAANGLILFHNFGSTRYVVATEASTPGVYYTVDYSSFGGDYYIGNLGNSELLVVAEEYDENTAITSQNLTTGNLLDAYTVWNLQYRQNDQYYVGIEIDETMYYLNMNDNLDSTLDDTRVTFSTTPMLWEITLSHTLTVAIKGEGTSHLNVSPNSGILHCTELPSSTADNIKDYAWRIMRVENYVETTDVNLIYNDWMAPDSHQEIQLLSSIPADASWHNYEDFEISITDTSYASANISIQPPDDPNCWDIHTNDKEGHVNISVKHIPSGNIFYFPLTIGQLIPDGTYALRNRGSGRYMYTPALSQGVTIRQGSLIDHLSRQWVFDYDSTSGYYTIATALSTDDTIHYVAVTDGSTAANASIIQTPTLSDAAKWRIIMTRNGNYKLIPKSAATATDEMALAAPSNGTAPLLQTSYTLDSACYDEWFIRYDAFLGAYDEEPSKDRATFIFNMMVELYESDLSLDYLNNYYKHYSKNEMTAIMENSTFFAVHTHGSRESFLIGTDANGNSYRYTIEDIAQTDLSNVKLIVFMTCNGGVGGYDSTRDPTNLVEACIDAGAETVLAFSTYTPVISCNYWLADVFSLMRGGSMTLNEAIDAIDNEELVFPPDYGYNSAPPELENSLELYELSDIAIVGGNGSITFSEIFS
ncbi:MAG: RICIN domain-containing protein [Clostridia bacterium]|nr:RICIN domain-containing protein [Clostridia bacterium]